MYDDCFQDGPIHIIATGFKEKFSLLNLYIQELNGPLAFRLIYVIYHIFIPIVLNGSSVMVHA